MVVKIFVSEPLLIPWIFGLLVWLERNLFKGIVQGATSNLCICEKEYLDVFGIE